MDSRITFSEALDVELSSHVTTAPAGSTPVSSTMIKLIAGFIGAAIAVASAYSKGIREGYQLGYADGRTKTLAWLKEATKAETTTTEPARAEIQPETSHPLEYGRIPPHLQMSRSETPPQLMQRAQAAREEAERKRKEREEGDE